MLATVIAAFVVRVALATGTPQDRALQSTTPFSTWYNRPFDVSCPQSAPDGQPMYLFGFQGQSTTSMVISVGEYYCSSNTVFGVAEPSPNCAVPPRGVVRVSDDAGATWRCGGDTAPANTLRYGAAWVSGEFLFVEKKAHSACIAGGVFADKDAEGPTRSVTCTCDYGRTWYEAAPLPVASWRGTLAFLNGISVLYVGGNRSDGSNDLFLGILDPDICTLFQWLRIDSPASFGSRLYPLVHTQMSGYSVGTQRVVVGGGVRVAGLTGYHTPPLTEPGTEPGTEPRRTSDSESESDSGAQLDSATARRRRQLVQQAIRSVRRSAAQLVAGSDQSSGSGGSGDSSDSSSGGSNSSSGVETRAPRAAPRPLQDSAPTSAIITLTDVYVCDPCVDLTFVRSNTTLPVDADNAVPSSIILPIQGRSLVGTRFEAQCYDPFGEAPACLLLVTGQRQFYSATRYNPNLVWQSVDALVLAVQDLSQPPAPKLLGWNLRSPAVTNDPVAGPMLIALAPQQHMIVGIMPVECRAGCNPGYVHSGCATGPRNYTCERCASCNMGTTYLVSECYTGEGPTGSYARDTVCAGCSTCGLGFDQVRACNVSTDTVCVAVESQQQVLRELRSTSLVVSFYLLPIVAAFSVMLRLHYMLQKPLVPLTPSTSSASAAASAASGAGATLPTAVSTGDGAYSNSGMSVASASSANALSVDVLFHNAVPTLTGEQRLHWQSARVLAATLRPVHACCGRRVPRSARSSSSGSSSAVQAGSGAGTTPSRGRAATLLLLHIDTAYTTATAVSNVLLILVCWLEALSFSLKAVSVAALLTLFFGVCISLAVAQAYGCRKCGARSKTATPQQQLQQAQQQQLYVPLSARWAAFSSTLFALVHPRNALSVALVQAAQAGADGAGGDKASRLMPRDRIRSLLVYASAGTFALEFSTTALCAVLFSGSVGTPLKYDPFSLYAGSGFAVNCVGLIIACCYLGLLWTGYCVTVGGVSPPVPTQTVMSPLSLQAERSLRVGHLREAGGASTAPSLAAAVAGSPGFLPGSPVMLTPAALAAMPLQQQQQLHMHMMQQPMFAFVPTPAPGSTVTSSGGAGSSGGGVGSPSGRASPPAPGNASSSSSTSNSSAATSSAAPQMMHVPVPMAQMQHMAQMQQMQQMQHMAQMAQMGLQPMQMTMQVPLQMQMQMSPGQMQQMHMQAMQQMAAMQRMQHAQLVAAAAAAAQQAGAPGPTAAAAPASPVPANAAANAAAAALGGAALSSAVPEDAPIAARIAILRRALEEIAGREALAADSGTSSSGADSGGASGGANSGSDSDHSSAGTSPGSQVGLATAAPAIRARTGTDSGSGSGGVGVVVPRGPRFAPVAARTVVRPQALAALPPPPAAAHAAAPAAAARLRPAPPAVGEDPVSDSD